MKKYKKTSKNRYIIILLLILLMLFLVSKLIFDRKPLSMAGEENYQSRFLRPDKYKKIDSSFFIRIIQHTFPNKKAQRQYVLKPSLKGLSSSFFTGIFKINFNNPLTFIQAQFPVAVAHHDVLMANIPGNKDKQMEEDWSREIHLVDCNGEEKSVSADRDVTNEYDVDKNRPEDDEKEGIYAIDDENVVDSLNSVSIADLKDVTKPKSIRIEKDKPSILIYHTHGTESYKPVTEGNYHSLKKEYTVMGVADIITAELEKKGYNVIHDITYHDYPSYSGSYNRSAATVKSILEKNSSIRVILDVHRDGFDKIDTRNDRMKLIENSRVKINGEYAARFQFVIGATSKNRKEVECFARFVKAVSDSKYPGFSKDILVKQYGSYNQYLSDHSALVELGANANTIEEARRAGCYFADVVADALKLLSE
ncbi:MAG TPA: stage II sporulation protein P [Oscillospiraceae bacterium]|nr:stage II sporulation protein P [Oscillospiraceae bacterium]